MSKVSNIDQIFNFLDYPQDTFYFIQIIKRRKENPDMKNSQQVIKTFYIDSKESYNKYIPRIIDTCDTNNARAYINLNKRSYKRVNLEMIKYLADLSISGQHKACSSAFEKVSGRNSNETGKTKKWILDVDTLDRSIINNVVVHINSVKPDGEKVLMINDTKNGYHIITTPFDPRGFKDLFPDIEIKKDNPTILYCP